MPWYPLCRSVADHYLPQLLLVLDPNVKSAYAKDRWATNFFKAGMKLLEGVVSTRLLHYSADEE